MKKIISKAAIISIIMGPLCSEVQSIQLQSEIAFTPLDIEYETVKLQTDGQIISEKQEILAQHKQGSGDKAASFDEMSAWLSQGDDEKKSKDDAKKKKLAQTPGGGVGMAHIPLKNINNQQYIGEAYFGDKGQKMTMQFDTGSALVYVLTDACKDNCNKQEKYHLTQKADASNSDSRIEYGYGSGYINGQVSNEKICFGPDQKTAPCLSDMKILEADQATGVENDRFAGIIGLSPRSTEKAIAPFVAQVAEANKMATTDQLSSTFSFYLSKNPEEDGMVTFGGYDLAKFAKPGASEGDIFWSKMIPNEKYWTVGMSDVGLKDKKNKMMPLYDIKPNYAIMDTGVSYAIIPSKDFESIKNVLTESYNVTFKAPEDSTNVSTYHCQCADYENLPDIQIALDLQEKGHSKAKKSAPEPEYSFTQLSQKGTVQSLVQLSQGGFVKSEDDEDRTKLPENRASEGSKLFTITKEQYMEKGNGKCGTFRITPSDTPFGNNSSQNYWVLGDIFLQNYYSIYDYPNNKVGLVESKDYGVMGTGWK